MTRCESYPPCFGTIYFPTAPVLISRAVSVIKLIFCTIYSLQIPP